MIDDQNLIAEYKDKFLQKHKSMKQKVSILFSAENSIVAQDDFLHSTEFKQKFNQEMKKEKQKLLSKKKKMIKSVEADLQSKILNKIRQEHSLAQKSIEAQQNMISTTLNFTNTLIQDQDEQKLLKNIDDRLLGTILDKIKRCESILQQKKSMRMAQTRQMQEECKQSLQKIKDLLNANPVQIIKHLNLLDKTGEYITQILNLKDIEKKWTRQIKLQQGFTVQVSDESFPDLQSQIDSFRDVIEEFKDKETEQAIKLMQNYQSVVDSDKENFQRNTQHFYENQSMDNLKRLQNLSQVYQEQEFKMIQHESSQSIKLINNQRRRCIIRGFQRINNLMREFVRMFEPNMTLEIKVVSLDKDGEVAKDGGELNGNDEDGNSYISEDIVDAMLRDYSSEVLDEYLEEQAQMNTSKSGKSNSGILKFKKNITAELKNQLTDLIKNRKNNQKSNEANNSYKFQIQLGRVNYTQEQGQSVSSSVQSVLSKNSVEMLSGGQKSIIGLSVFAAFSMLDSQNRRILLFDQADASLDLKYRMGFSQLVDKLKEETQLFIVSFRKEIIDSIDHFYEVRYFQRVSYVKEINKKGAIKVIALSSSANENQQAQQQNGQKENAELLNQDNTQ